MTIHNLLLLHHLRLTIYHSPEDKRYIPYHHHLYPMMATLMAVSPSRVCRKLLGKTPPRVSFCSIPKAFYGVRTPIWETKPWTAKIWAKCPAVRRSSSRTAPRFDCPDNSRHRTRSPDPAIPI